LRNALDAVSARKLGRYVREHKIRIVHAHLARDYPLASYAARRSPGSRLIITRHVLFPLNRLHSITLSQVARIIAVSEAVARQLRTHGSIPSERITVIPNGIDVQRFEGARSQSEQHNFRRQRKISEDRMLIGTVGEIKALKGHEEFLRAASIIRRKFPRAEFLIAGLDASRDGKNRAALETLIAQLKLGDAVRLIGWVDDLASLYCALDVFVSASRTESFGLAIAEAMASATPVVATATEGASEIITNQETGLLVPIADVEALAAALTDLLGDEDKRRRFAASGRERIQQQFSLGRMVPATEEVYREVLGEKN
jgi:glycosyltransferase involved in cell wall biosynthesis